MKRTLTFLIALLPVLCFSQVITPDGKYATGHIRSVSDSVFRLPKGLLGSNNGKRISIVGQDTAQVRYNLADSALYLHTGSQWLKVGGGGTYTEGYGIDILSNVISVDSSILAGSLTGGDTTIFDMVIDSTLQPGSRVLVSGGNKKITSDSYFLYDTVNNKLMINHFNIGAGGVSTKLFVNGNSALNGVLTFNSAVIANTPTTSAGTYDLLTRNTSTGVMEKILSNTLLRWTDTTSTIATQFDLTAFNKYRFGVTGEDESLTQDRYVNGHGVYTMELDSLSYFALEGNSGSYLRTEMLGSNPYINLAFTGTGFGSNLTMSGGASDADIIFGSSGGGGNQYFSTDALATGNFSQIGGSHNVAGRWIDNRYEAFVSATTASNSHVEQWLEQWAGSSSQWFTNSRYLMDSTGFKIQTHRKTGAKNTALYKGLVVDTSSNIVLENYPSTRNDGLIQKALYISDAAGKVRYGTIDTTFFATHTYTEALVAGVAIPTLQQVATAGNTFTNGSAVITLNAFGDIDVDNRGIGTGIKWRRGDLTNAPQASMYYAASLTSTVLEVGNTAGFLSRFYVNHIADGNNDHFRFPTANNGSLLDTLASLQDIRNGGGGGGNVIDDLEATLNAGSTITSQSIDATNLNIITSGSFKAYSGVGNAQSGIVGSANNSVLFGTYADIVSSNQLAEISMDNNSGAGNTHMILTAKRVANSYHRMSFSDTALFIEALTAGVAGAHIYIPDLPNEPGTAFLKYNAVDGKVSWSTASTVGGSGENIYNTSAMLTANRTLTGNANTYALNFDSLNSFRVQRNGVTRILMSSTITELSSPNTTAGISANNSNALMSYSANALRVMADSVTSTRLIAYEAPFYTSLLTWFALTPKYYVDSLVAAATIGGSGDVTKVGTPLDNQVGVWTGDGTIEGDADLTFDGTTLAIAGNTATSSLRINSLEVQGYALNNAWFGDNVYYNGSFVHRQTGESGMFYFFGKEGQFRMSNSVAAGGAATPRYVLKFDADGKVGLGGDGNVNKGNFTNYALAADRSGTNVTITQLNTTDVALLIQLKASSAENALEIKNSGGTALLTFTEAGVLKLNTVAQDDAEDKVLVWDDASEEIEWRDASTLGGGSGGHTIEEEGTPLTAQPDLNFIGGGITAANDAGNTATTITLDADLDYLATFTPTANVKTILNAADYAAIRTALTLTIGTNVQAYDADLTSWAAFGPGAATAVATAATANTLVLRDGDANITGNNWLGGYTTTATAAGTTTLTVGSAYLQYFTGATTQTVTLPVTSTLTLGHQFVIVNNSTGNVTVNSSGGNAVIVLAGGTSTVVTCILTSGTSAASWSQSYSAANLVSGKKLTINNTLILAGTDGTTMTFPTTSATIARSDAAQTFTGTQTFSAVVTTNNAITASGNAATVPITSNLSTVTNNSAATLTITITTGAADGQELTVRILDFSGVAQTIVWVNTENSSIAAPTTSNGSTSLFLSVKFIYNNATSKWRCIGFA